jgi:hypothetical protein
MRRRFPNDDAFAGAAGLFGMPEVLMKRGSGEPDEEKVRKLEGVDSGSNDANLGVTTPYDSH